MARVLRLAEVGVLWRSMPTASDSKSIRVADPCATNAPAFKVWGHEPGGPGKWEVIVPARVGCHAPAGTLAWVPCIPASVGCRLKPEEIPNKFRGAVAARNSWYSILACLAATSTVCNRTQSNDKCVALLATDTCRQSVTSMECWHRARTAACMDEQ